jgi:hypothetical protein
MGTGPHVPDGHRSVDEIYVELQRKIEAVLAGNVIDAA